MKVLLLTALTALAALVIGAGASARTVMPSCADATPYSIQAVDPCAPAAPASDSVAPFQVDVLGGDGHPATPPATGIATWYLVGIAAGSALAVAGIALLLLYGRRRRIEARAVLA
jgi:hypothetical protein